MPNTTDLLLLVPTQTMFIASPAGVVRLCYETSPTIAAGFNATQTSTTAQNSPVLACIISKQTVHDTARKMLQGTTAGILRAKYNHGEIGGTL
jgi:hypothetical protein